MIFFNHAQFVDDAEKVEQVTPHHRVFAGKLREAGTLLLGGPLVDGNGAMFVYQVEHRAAVDRIIAEDPFQTEGVYARTTIKEWNVIGVNRAELTALADRLKQ